MYRESFEGGLTPKLGPTRRVIGALQCLLGVRWSGSSSATSRGGTIKATYLSGWCARNASNKRRATTFRCSIVSAGVMMFSRCCSLGGSTISLSATGARRFVVLFSAGDGGHLAPYGAMESRAQYAIEGRWHRVLRDVGGDPPGLVAGEQMSLANAPSSSVLVLVG